MFNEEHNMVISGVVDQDVINPRLAVVQHRHRLKMTKAKHNESPRTPSTIANSDVDSDKSDNILSDIAHTTSESGSTSPSRQRASDSPFLSRSRGDTPSIYTIFSGLRASSNFPLRSRGCVPDAIQYYLEEYAPSRLRICHQLNISNPYITLLFPLALENAELFSAIVALAYALRSSKSSGKVSNQEVLHYRSSAISKLRRKLATENGVVDDAMILSALCLMLLDVCLSEYKALEAHRRGLSLMVLSRGGLESLGLNGLVKSALLQFEYYFIAETGSPSEFIPYREAEPLNYPSHPFSPTMCAMISGMPSGFEDLALTGRLSTELLRTLAHISKWTNCTNRLRDTNHISLREQDFVLKYEPWEDLHDLSFCLRCLSPEAVFERCLCLALLLYTSKVFDKLQTPMIQRCRQELTGLLSAIPILPEEQIVLVWIWVVAIESWNFGRLMPPGALLRNLLNCRVEAISQWHDIEPMLKLCLWNPSVLKDWELCWTQTGDWDG